MMTASAMTDKQLPLLLAAPMPGSASRYELFVKYVSHASACMLHSILQQHILLVLEDTSNILCAAYPADC